MRINGIASFSQNKVDITGSKSAGTKNAALLQRFFGAFFKAF